MPLLNYTTKVDEHKTVSEIQTLLSKKGAERVSIEYADGRPEALTFHFPVRGTHVPFKLPCRFDGVRQAMLKECSTAQVRRRREKDAEFTKQSRRVAWRIIKDWVNAQLALIEAGQAELSEVFMPYVVSTSGQTLFEAFSSNPDVLLSLGGKSQLLLSS